MKSKVERYVYNKTIQLRKQGIEVKLHDDIFLDDGVKVQGMFDGFTSTVNIGMSGDVESWLSIFIHECCHAKQFIDGRKPWVDLGNVYKKKDGAAIFYGWLAGEEYKLDVVYKAMQLTRAMELDCEKLTVAEIKRHELDDIINLDDYIRDANSYLLFHNVAYVTRKWYDQKYKHNKGVEACLPTTFMKNYDVIPMDFYRACIEHCYK